MANDNNNNRLTPHMAALFWGYLMRIVLITLLPWMTWLSIMLIDAQRDIAVIQGNRFTAADGLRLQQEMGTMHPSYREFNALETQVENHEQRIDDLERGR